MRDVTFEEFEALVQKAIDGLPEEFAAKMANIDICIEDQPSLEIQQKMRVGVNNLLGLYSGVSLDRRSDVFPPLIPDKITLYRKNIENISATYEDLCHQIQKTVLHEIGHYFGIDDHRLRALGF